MTISPQYVRGMAEMMRNEYLVNEKKQLPMLAEKIIQLAKDNGVELEIKYGVKQDGLDLIAGYYVTAPQYNKMFFEQDVYMDDNSEKNTQKALNYMAGMIQKLKEIKS